MKRLVFLGVLVAQLPRAALADGYCDHVQEVAAAESALRFAPTVFGTVGYSRDGSVGGVDGAASSRPRMTVGVSYALTGPLEGAAIRERARADCQRHTALAQIEDATIARGLALRASVLEAAVPDAIRMREVVEDALAQRLATQAELVAIRLRVDELRGMAAEIRQRLASLHAPQREVGGALARYRVADAQLERHEARLRRLAALDVTVRAGYDRFLDRTNDAPYFAMVSVSVNLGVLAQGGANERAATARAHRSSGGDLRAAAEAQLATSTTRAAETAALIAELVSQLAAVGRGGGDDGRRYQQALWFDLIKVRAEHADATARAAALRDVLR